jgi:hypothetical protein
MRTVRHVSAVGAAILMLGAGLAPTARADDFGVALNGTYAVKSDGEWAKTNDVFIDEQTVLETWQITTTCSSPLECTGEVRSDRGYTASVSLAEYWYIRHDIPNWLPCPDGTFATGHQLFIILGWDPTQNRQNRSSDLLLGRNVTKSDSGACGVNKPKVIELPIEVRKISGA